MSFPLSFLLIRNGFIELGIGVWVEIKIDDDLDSTLSVFNRFDRAMN